MGYCKYPGRTLVWCSYLLILLVLSVCVNGTAPSSNGFINIDCGIASNTSYVDSVTGLTYVSDDQYIDTGINSNVSSLYTDLETLRIFPNNIKNCYTLKPVTEGLKYLVRAAFYYGNYDKAWKPPSFDLYFGVNFWTTVNISLWDYYYPYEIIAIAPANYIQVCLVNTGHGIPFISVLELRPINNTLYQADSEQSLNMTYRGDAGSNNKYALRYPQDAHDRLWESLMLTSWTSISTTSTPEGRAFEIPSSVLQTAAIPSSANGSIDLNWSAPDTSTIFFVVLHFAEIQVLQTNSLREFYIYANGELFFKDPVPLSNTIGSYAWYEPTGHINYNVSLKSSARATLPPILNAIELYTILPVTLLPTDNGEVTAINSIKASYNISKGWNGDPCVPLSLHWTGVNCSIDSTNIPKITVLNISSSGLNGTIISDFGSLISLKMLDLSNNNLSGNIPDSLDQLVSLTYLDLSGNSGLSGTLPAGLQKRQNDGRLTVIFNSKPHGTGHRNSSKAVIIVAVVAVFPILGAAALFLYLIMKMKDNEDTGNFGMACFSKVTENQEDSTASEAGIKELNINKRKFSFAELKDVTNNFRDEIGGGGFGKVFKGRLEDGNEVAVKVRSDQLSSQGIEQFLNEVDKLSRVHHKNLVSLMGYCIDGDHIALVYEHMEKGNLQQWIGDTGHSLSWKQRLQIAYESAQGCQYLHKMCTPPLIHRDIKSNNILLTANLEAKVSDFGSARECSGTHVTTQIIGTLGYLDPYYASTAELTEKSDVYSFGVVLLEIVTGKSPIIKGPEGNYNLTQFVQERLSKGNIESILDPNMRGQYNINSIWKVAELALRCTDSPVRRPDMTEIVRELEETMNLEVSCIDTSKVASEDISRYTIGGEVHDGNFNMAHTGGMRQPDYGPSPR